MGGDPLLHEKENGPSVCKRKREQKRFDCVALCDRATKRRHPDWGTRFKKTVKNQRARLKKVRGGIVDLLERRRPFLWKVIQFFQGQSDCLCEAAFEGGPTTTTTSRMHIEKKS